MWGGDCDRRRGKGVRKENGVIFKLTSAKQSTGIEELFKIVANKYIDPNYVDNSFITFWRGKDEKEGKSRKAS